MGDFLDATSQFDGTDVFLASHQFFAKRELQLERLKSKNGVHKHDTCNNDFEAKLKHLRSEMICLVEQDMTLMRQLLNLCDIVEDLRFTHISRSSSVGSLLDTDNENASINRLLVNEDTPPIKRTPTEYYARENSVLRITISPRQRYGSQTSDKEEEQKQGTLSAIDLYSAKSPPNTVSCIDSLKSEIEEGILDEKEAETPEGLLEVATGKCGHISQASIDSGIHLESTAHEVEV